jgi:hypothetical protein
MQSDRRRNRLPGWRALLYHPRRRSVRRTDDRRRLILLDWYPDALLVLSALVLILSVTDALLTLYLLHHGAYELNPILAYFLKKGPLSFLAVKYLLTVLGVTIAVLAYGVFIPFLRMFAHDLLKIFAGAFAVVIAWQLFLACRYVI